MMHTLFVPIATLTAGALLPGETQAADLEVVYEGRVIANADQTPSRFDGTDFGSMLYTVGPVERQFRIFNKGTSTLHLGDAVSSSPVFSVSGLAQSIAPGAYDDFTIAFAPTQAGFVSAVIGLKGASSELLYTFAVAGTGVAPMPPPPPPPNEHPEPDEPLPGLPNFNPAEIAISYNGVSISAGDMSPSGAKGTSFGSADVATGAITHTFRIHNNGGFPLPINYAHSTNTEFTIEGMPDVGINGESYVDFFVTFAPEYTGTRTSIITIFNGDEDQSEFSFKVSGIGVSTNNKQVIYAGDAKVLRGSSVSVPFYYDVSNDNNTLTGIGFNIHYNSAVVSFIGFEDTDPFGAQIFSLSESALADVNDLDKDSSTDAFVQVHYANLTNGANWPGQPLPLMLGKIVFKASGAFAPGSSTVVRFSPISTAGAYGFESTPVTISVPTVSSDIDGNGEVAGLSDGLLMFRYLFRMPDFANGAIGSGASRNAEQIASYIEANKLPYFDLDGNGQVAALSDGLLFFRYLFRMPNFADGATGAGSTRSSTQIAAYIDSLKPGAAPMPARAQTFRSTATFAMDAESAEQVVSPVDAPSKAGTGDTLDLSWSYAASNGASNLNGLLLRVHYDSSRLKYVEPVFVNETNTDIVYSTVPAADIEDFDNDPSTDAYLLVGWASFNLAWPGSAALEDLMTLRFKAVAGGNATVRLSAAETSPGYTLDAAGLSIDINGVAPAPGQPTIAEAFGKGADQSGYVFVGGEMGYVYVGDHPLAWHNGLGWFSVAAGTAEAGLWIWDYELGWLWMHLQSYPYVYSPTLGAWLYNLPGAPIDHGMRWFFDFTAKDWFNSR